MLNLLPVLTGVAGAASLGLGYSALTILPSLPSAIQTAFPEAGNFVIDNNDSFILVGYVLLLISFLLLVI